MRRLRSQEEIKDLSRFLGYGTARIRLQKYGITPEEALDLLSLQGSRCAICNCLLDPEDGDWNNRPQLDHDHETNAVRGWLCTLCNRGIGYFKDKPELLRKALEYLERSQS